MKKGEDGRFKLFFDGGILIYIFVISIVFFGLLDMFVYVNSTSHKQTPVFICNNKKD